MDAPPLMEVGDKWTARFHNKGDKREPYLFTNEVKAVDSTSAWICSETQEPNAQRPRALWRYDLKRADFLERFEFDPAAPNGAGNRLLNRQPNDDNLRFPLSVGKKYSVKSHWDNGEGYTELKAEVQAFEKVKVEAGEFDAYRIKYEGWWTRTKNGNFSGRAESTQWYAPTVKRLIKSEFFDRTTGGQIWTQNTFELVKWEPAGSGKGASIALPGASTAK